MACVNNPLGWHELKPTLQGHARTVPGPLNRKGHLARGCHSPEELAVRMCEALLVSDGKVGHNVGP